MQKITAMATYHSNIQSKFNPCLAKCDETQKSELGFTLSTLQKSSQLGKHPSSTQQCPDLLIPNNKVATTFQKKLQGVRTVLSRKDTLVSYQDELSRPQSRLDEDQLRLILERRRLLEQMDARLDRAAQERGVWCDESEGEQTIISDDEQQMLEQIECLEKLVQQMSFQSKQSGIQKIKRRVDPHQNYFKPIPPQKATGGSKQTSKTKHDNNKPLRVTAKFNEALGKLRKMLQIEAEAQKLLQQSQFRTLQSSRNSLPALQRGSRREPHLSSSSKHIGLPNRDNSFGKWALRRVQRQKDSHGGNSTSRINK